MSILEDKDKTLLLLNSILKSYEHFKDAMVYGRVQTITFEEVQSTIKATKLQKTIETQEGIT